MDKVKIRLFIDGDGWMSETNSPLVIEMFGTGLLPLPFLKDTEADKVLAVVTQLNPDDEVFVSQEAI